MILYVTTTDVNVSVQFMLILSVKSIDFSIRPLIVMRIRKSISRNFESLSEPSKFEVSNLRCITNVQRFVDCFVAQKVSHDICRRRRPSSEKTPQWVRSFSMARAGPGPVS